MSPDTNCIELTDIEGTPLADLTGMLKRLLSPDPPEGGNPPADPPQNPPANPPAPPAGAPPPTATAVLAGKSQREIDLERELEDEKKARKKADMDAAALIDEKEQLKKAGANKPVKNFLEKFLDDED